MDSSTLSPALVAWCGFCAIIIGAVVSALRPDNTFLPFSLSTKTRAILALVLGAIAACLTNITHGTPWMQAIGAALVSVITGFAASGAPRAVAGVVLMLCLSTGVSGCKALFPNGAKSVIADADMLCIIANAAFPNATIQTVCRIEGDAADIERAIEAVASVERAHLASAHMAGVVEGYRAVGALPPAGK